MKRIFFLSAILFLSGAGCSRVTPIVPAPQPPPVACTMEARLCPDGSAVGRTGPNCEFVPCPTENATSTPFPVPTPIIPIPPPIPVSINKTCDGLADTSCGVGYQCLQDCGPPVARVDDVPPPFHCQTDAFAKKPRMCPICLASNTVIATPNGDVNVTDLKVGMQVWSQNADGKKVVQTIVRVVHTPVPSTHKVVHLLLSDKREVWVSPNHPLLDGQPVSSLHVGESYDGSEVISVDLVPYWDSATYDLLPDGGTSAYWANGILLLSTLRL